MTNSSQPNQVARQWGRLMTFLAKYHSWTLLGIDNVPAEGGAVFTCTHSLASYDLFILGYASKGLLGRPAHVLGDDLMFRVPGFAPVLRDMGFMARISREHIVERLQQGDLIGIAPGGMKESLRDTRTNPYDFDWSNRLGFVWVAMLAGVPVIPIVCPRSNDIFTVYGNPVTSWIYKQLKVPLPLFRGLGPTPLPRPIKLVSVIGEPVYPDVAPDQVQKEDVVRIHQRVVDTTRTLTEQVLQMSDDEINKLNPVGFPYS